jgi:hypothetical protein
MRVGVARREASAMLRSTDIPLLYVDCDIPDGMTLVEWRRDKVAAGRRADHEVAQARAAARSAALKRLLPRLAPRPRPVLRPRFA